MAGEKVTIKGKEYTVVEKKSISHLGSKFHGQYKTVLKDSDGNKFKHVGKRIAGNSTIHEM